MNITIIAVGRIGNSIEAELVNRYCNRFNKLNKFLGFDPLQIVEIDDKKFKTKTLQGKKISEIVNKNLNQVLCDTNGMVTAKIKSIRPPEPYKGKGIKEQGQYILRKEGKKK